MLVIPLMAIVNAWWGSREEDAAPKWLAGVAVAIGAYATTHDPVFSLIWGVGYLVFRFPAMSKVGFAAFHGRPISKGAAFYWWISRSGLLFPTFVALWFVYATRELAPIGFLSIGYGLIYSILGAIYGDIPGIARRAEYLSGAWIGVLIYISGRMI